MTTGLLFKEPFLGNQKVASSWLKKISDRSQREFIAFRDLTRRAPKIRCKTYVSRIAAAALNAGDI
ncbi:hypothetical protein GGI35DRAFT_463829 [Trichoderma velutinum]